VFEGVQLRQVRDLQAALRLQLGRLVPGDVALNDAPAMWQAYDTIERLAAAAKTLLAARVEESGVAQRGGERGAAEFLARRSGSSLGAARASLEVSKKVAELPHTTAALRRGELSRPQAEEIAHAAAVNPGAEQSLLHRAANSSLAELREACARTRAQADPDPDATHRRIHHERRVRRWTDRESAWNLAARGTPDAGSRFNAAFDPIIDELFHAARREGRHEPREAYAFDALVELARRHGTPGAAPVRADSRESGTGHPVDGGDDQVAAPRRRVVEPTHLALLRVDLEALLRGHTEGDELCEIAGVGPVPVDAARGLLGESMIKLVITDGVDVANVTHLGRGPTVAQRVALLWSSPACTVLGCPRLHSQGIQHDHRKPWTAVQETALDNIDRLCDHHHDLKTRRGWALVPGTGRRSMVPPDDPRHHGIRATGPPGCDESPSVASRARRTKPGRRRRLTPTRPVRRDQVTSRSVPFSTS
jgi:Domain of unknown function (DUF222)